MVDTYRRLARLTGDARTVLALAAAFAAAQSLLLAPLALVVERMFDRYIPRRDTTAILVAGGLMLLLYLASTCWGSSRGGSRSG